jgi:2-keto-4-pentenoate hydratase/2-oxohepta-3-ene-1,7-dioic acid hydratase in catechol pathway
VGKNYLPHIDEMGLTANAEPTLFLKPSSAIVGPGDNIVLPRQSNQVELEVELAVVIGALTQNVSAEDVLNTCGASPSPMTLRLATCKPLMISGRVQNHLTLFAHSALGSKLSSYLKTRSSRVALTVRLLQSSTIDQMIFTVPQIISYVSQNMTLLPGDVIITGTPAGITKINSGDIIECEVEGVGTLINQAN